MTYRNNDPKGVAGSTKIQLHLVPRSFIHGVAEALTDGAVKYGAYNWRENPVCASTYISALGRHMDAWIDGDEIATDSLVHHLKHAAACIAILIDAASVGTLVDDRPPKGNAAQLQAEYAAKHIERIALPHWDPKWGSPGGLPDKKYRAVARHPMASETLREQDFARDDDASGV